MSTTIITSGTTTFTGIISSANAQSRPTSLTTSAAITPLDPLASRTTQQPSATNLPPRNAQCGTGILTIQTFFPACAVLASNGTYSVLTRCCRGAPIVLYNTECNLWCEARNQTLDALNSCISDARRSDNISSPILCNRAGASFSSLLPENTADPATRTTPTGLATLGPSATPNSGAPSGLRSAPVEGSVSFGAMAAVALLALGGFTSLLV